MPRPLPYEALYDIVDRADGTTIIEGQETHCDESRNGSPGARILEGVTGL